MKYRHIFYTIRAAAVNTGVLVMKTVINNDMPIEKMCSENQRENFCGWNIHLYWLPVRFFKCSLLKTNISSENVKWSSLNKVIIPIKAVIKYLNY